MTELPRAVFLSYASQDAGAARSICEALRAAGIEVWFDQSEIHGGDRWDRKIRLQIKDCALFIPVISANTQARLEGYFRLEWRLAVERTHAMADAKAFLVPVVIDDTTDADAHVPEPFRAFQWTRLHAGRTTAAFVQHVSGLLARDRQAPMAPSRTPAGATLNEVASTSATARPMAVAWWLVGLAVACILALAGYLLLRHTVPADTAASASSHPSAPPAEPERPRIAVLPFENLSPDPNNAFFTDGMHEEILTALANGVPGLDVISRTTMDTYKGKAVTAPSLAKELHCNYVLEGSMLREGNEVRLALQLIDARSDRNVWAQDFDRKVINAMALESEVAAAVASQLSIKLAASESNQSQSTDAAAFDLYLKARAASENADQNSALGDWQGVENQLDRALQLDPAFTRAYIERIGVRVSLFIFNHDAGGTGLPAAHQDLDAAVKLAPRDPLVIAAEALLAYAEKDYGRSLNLFQAAESAGLADSRMLAWKGRLLFAMGSYRQAAALNERLMNLDPKNQVPEGERWFALMELHQPQEATRVADLAPPAVRNVQQATIHGMFGGDRAVFDASNTAMTAAPLDSAYHIEIYLGPLVVNGLEYLGQFEQARRVIDKAKVDSIRLGNLDWPPYRIGRFPVADMRGWLDLLLVDAPQATRDGQAILKFLGSAPETRWNLWFRTLLRADAQLFSGDRDGAIATADKAVALTRAEADVSDRMDALVWATQIRAWAGAQEDAAARLETLSFSVPGLWPGEPVLDPVWAVPLARNDRYVRLRGRLEAQMKAAKF